MKKKMPETVFNMIEDIRLKEKIAYSRHKSGLKIFVCPKPGFAERCAMLGTTLGSCDSRFKIKGEADFTVLPDGVAHFLEHKMFETDDGKDVLALFGEQGASGNAFTSFDKTVYEFSCTENFEESLRILLDFVRKPCFSDESVNREKGIISQEIKMYEDSPSWQVNFNLMKALYHSPELKADIAGTVESISKINAELLMKTFGAFYNPANMALCICGDVSVESISKIVDECFKGSEPVEVTVDRAQEPEAVAMKSITKKMPVSTPYFAIGIKNCDGPLEGGAYARREAAMAVLLELLAGKSSPFYKKLYDRGIINDTFSTDFTSASAFAFSVFSGQSENPEEVLEALRKSIDALLKNGIDEDRFDKLKKAIYGETMTVFNRTDDITYSLITACFAGTEFFGQYDAYMTLTLTDVMSELEKMTQDRTAISVIEII